MTMHVSLPKHLEMMIHDRVKSGMYQSVSEVVREALRDFFKSRDGYTDDQINWIRKEIGGRMEKVKAGKSKLIEANRYFDEADKRFSKTK